MNEHEKLDKREVLLEHLATNSKKLQQQRLKTGTLDIRRLDATIRIAKELKMLSEVINEFWEHPEGEAIVGSA